jgi:beta-aspartyl-peptidase (threonine type)
MDQRKSVATALLTALLCSSCATSATPASARTPASDGQCFQNREFTLLIHGGAGEVDAEDQKIMEPIIKTMLQEGAHRLERGASALDVVEFAIKTMEDSKAFNAGRGGIANQAGVVELDAAIMEGTHRMAGSVASVRNIQNPISAARKVMQESQHVMLVGRGAEHFAKDHGLQPVDPGYFIYGKRRRGKEQHGTVGAVVLDRCGHLAAGTSTGGWDKKLPGRIGDSPIIGAGTFASDDTCAVSATGHGEFFIRWAVAHDISAKMEYQGLRVTDAASQVVAKLTRVQGEGGVIALDRHGNMAWPFNSQAMTRGYIKETGETGIGFGQQMSR